MPESRTARSAAVSAAAALAVVVGLCSLFPIVQGARWLGTGVVFVVLATAVSALARRAGLPTAAGALVALASLPLVALLVTSGLPLPTDAGIAAVLQDLQDAGTQIYTDSVPAADTPGIGLLVGLSAGVAAVIVDAVAVGLRAPLAGMLVVGALALVPGKALSTGTNGVLLVAVVAAVLLVVAADRRRRGAPPRLPGLAAGGAIAVVLTLVLQVVLPAPYASQAQGGPLPLFGSGVDPLVRLGENLRRGATTPVLTYRTTGEDKEVYLRLAVLEDFSGDVWSPDPADGNPSWYADLPTAPGLSADAVTGERTTTIMPSSPGAIGDRLPLPYPATQVVGVGRAGFKWDERGLTLAREDGSVVGDYSVTSAEVSTSAALLRRSATAAPADDAQALSLPRQVPAIIKRTADAWTRGAGTAYDRALAIQNRLRGGEFSYDETTPAERGYDGDGLGVIAEFLRVKAGYCIHYASTMAVMARLEGIPARIVVGYQPGEVQAGSSARLVTSDDLHSWPELYFDGVGWVRFEPTPGQGAVPAYAPVPTTGATPTPSDAVPSQAAATPEASDAAAAASRSGGGDGGAIIGAVGRGAAGTLAVAALLAAPGLLRRRIRRRRLSGDAGGAAGAWRELLDGLADLGLPTGAGRSPRGIEQVLAGHLGGAARPLAALGRVRAAYERQAYSPAPVAIGADDVRLVLDSAAERAGRRRRLIAAVAPRSLLATLTRSRLALRWPPPGSG